MKTLVILLSSLLIATSASGQNLDLILGEIEEFEGDHDPKCYATASRLEDFMYGTPLSDAARFQKNKLQKRLAQYVLLDTNKPGQEVVAEQINASFNKVIGVKEKAEGVFELTFPNDLRLDIDATDLRQYGSVAYSLRAILAVQQDAILDPEAQPLPVLGQTAIETLKHKLDLATLALLKEADAYARAHDEFEISKQNINRSWLRLFKTADSVKVAESSTAAKTFNSAPPLLGKIVKQKVASYAAYNQINNQLFVRNMQVYFARLSWPKDEAEAKNFRSAFVEAMIGYAVELYAGVMQTAQHNQHKNIEESDVAAFTDRFTPFSVNEYEDVEYFPRLPAADRVVLEAYDLDAFRDSGVHWVYLGYALESPEIKQFMDADPFAAELLAENIAQFGVLLLRVTGEEGIRQEKERLSTALLVKGLQLVQEKVNQNLQLKAGGEGQQMVLNSANDQVEEPAHSDLWFNDVTDQVGINFMHRSSDWLNRLLRSYLRRDETTGVITIPPAFGGSGVAAEDVNNDGYPDVLLLSGLGNRLYINNKDGSFKDVTVEAGLVYIRPEDRQPGEPRQPLIADLNNDGLQDIVITYVDDMHRVYQNLGNGRFADVTAGSGLGGKGLVGGPATVFDFDGDGLLDIYITYFGDYIHGVLPTLKRRNDNGLPNKLFRNTGNFKFQEVSAGVENSGWGQAVVHTDLNSDGRQDLIVGNDFGTNVYYINQGNGRFTDVSAQLGTDKPSYTMNIGLADLNQDLLPDIYISNIVTMNKDEKYVLPNEDTQMKFNMEKLAHMRVVEANDLFISEKTDQGLPSYQLGRELVGRGYNSTGWSWDADFFDADNDGDEDLYVLNGMNEYNLYSSENSYAGAGGDEAYIPVAAKESNVFFVNSNGKLNNVSERSGLDLLGNSRSAAYLDFDADGDLDIVVNDYHGAAHFYQNKAERLGLNWLKLKLQGDPKQQVNRDGIGARVIVTLPNGQSVWREVHGSIGYMSVHPKQLHLGLGQHRQADIRVIWPNGKETVMKSLAANTIHTIKLP